MNRLALVWFLVSAATLGADPARWRVTYDAAGLPVSETFLSEGQPTQTAELKFDRGQLVGRTVRGADQAELYTDVLYRWPDGRLRRLERTFADGSTVGLAWTFDAQGQLVSAWTDEGENHRETTFTSDATDDRRFEGPTEVLRRVTEWLDAGRSRATVTTPGGSKVVIEADASGRPLNEATTDAQGTTKVRTWTYDGQGRPLSLEVKGGDRWDYAYLESTKTVATLSRFGSTIRQETRVDGDLTEVRYFDRGQLVLVETYEAGRKAHSAYYQKGKVVRETTP